MPGWIGFPELLVLLLVLLLIFGPKRLPEMGRSLGKGMHEFKNSITGKHDENGGGELEAGSVEPPLEDPRVGQLAEELRLERRERAIDQALHEGRFTVGEADDYRRLYDADPDATSRVIENLPMSS